MAAEKPSESTPLRGLGNEEISSRVASALRTSLFWLLPLIMSPCLLLIGKASIGTERILVHWPISCAAAFASIISGGTPEGGAAAYFPVMILLLDCTPELTRSFGLCIQSLSMSMASIRILVSRTPVDWTVIMIALPAAAISQVTVLLIPGESSPEERAFWPPFMAGPAVDVTFMIIMTTMAFISALLLWEHSQAAQMGRDVPGHNRVHGLCAEEWNIRRVVALIVVAACGGVLSGLTATGTNIVVYVLTVTCFDLSPKVAVPTTVLITAALSITGACIILWHDEQFDINVNMTSETVVEVGGIAIDPPCSLQKCDLVGFLMAAAPVVVWGAPIGAEVMRRIPEAAVLLVIAVVALASCVGIFVHLEELHSISRLLVSAVCGIIFSPGTVLLLRQHRHTLFGGPTDDRGHDLEKR